MRTIWALLRDDGGAVLVEYAIVAAVLAAAGLATLAAIAATASDLLGHQVDGFAGLQTGS